MLIFGERLHYRGCGTWYCKDSNSNLAKLRPLRWSASESVRNAKTNSMKSLFPLTPLRNQMQNINILLFVHSMVGKNMSAPTCPFVEISIRVSDSFEPQLMALSNEFCATVL